MLRTQSKHLPWFSCWDDYLSWRPSASQPMGAVHSEVEKFCVSAGLTKVTKSRRAPSVYAHRHAFVKGQSDHRPVASLFGGSLIFMNRDREEGLSPIRARSITSDGMRKVLLADDSTTRSPSKANFNAWNTNFASLLWRAYNLSSADLRACNSYIVSNENLIALSKATEMPNDCFQGFACRKNR